MQVTGALMLARAALEQAAPEIANAAVRDKVAQALAALAEVDVGRASIGTAESMVLTERLWTFKCDDHEFRPSPGRYFIIPAKENRARFPPINPHQPS